jgi:hypothetical protein
MAKDLLLRISKNGIVKPLYSDGLELEEKKQIEEWANRTYWSMKGCQPKEPQTILTQQNPLVKASPKTP